MQSKILRALGLGCALALGLAACGPRHDDASITRDVMQRIGAEGGAAEPGVVVTTTRGDVVLTGIVRSTADRMRVEEIARDVSGVRAVVNRVEVASTPAPSAPPAVSAPPPAPSEMQRSDPGAAEDQPGESDAPRPTEPAPAE